MPSSGPAEQSGQESACLEVTFLDARSGQHLLAALGGHPRTSQGRRRVGPERARRAGSAQPWRQVLDDPLAAPKGLDFKLPAERDGIVSHLSDVLAVNAAELARKLQLPISDVLGRLTALEMDGVVKRHQEGYVRALRRGKERA